VTTRSPDLLLTCSPDLAEGALISPKASESNPHLRRIPGRNLRVFQIR